MRACEIPRLLNLEALTLIKPKTLNQFRVEGLGSFNTLKMILLSRKSHNPVTGVGVKGSGRGA